MHFDTHAGFRMLTEAGIKADHATALIKVVDSAIDEKMKDVVTTQYLDYKLDQKLGEVRLEFKKDIADLERRFYTSQFVLAGVIISSITLITRFF